ncbi:MAG: hypothetical protein AAF481_18580 [Acidobacteriota bacterium]
MEDWIHRFGAQHWFAQTLAVLVLFLFTFIPLVSLEWAPRWGWLVAGLEVGLIVGVIAVVKLSERFHLVLLSSVVTIMLNGLFVGRPEGATYLKGLGSFLGALADSLSSASAALGSSAPSSENLVRFVWAATAAFALCLLLGIFRHRHQEPEGFHATLDFDRVDASTVKALIGDWNYCVHGPTGDFSHSGEAAFTMTGKNLQLGGTRREMKVEDGRTSCTITWNARFMIYTNLSSGRFLRFEYVIRLPDGNLEAYATLDLRNVKRGLLTGAYDHLAGGCGTGTIEFQRLDLKQIGVA